MSKVSVWLRFIGDVTPAVVSGIFLTLSFPHFGNAAFAWIALVPLLLICVRASSLRHSFVLGFVTGGVHFAGMLYWIPNVMVEFGELVPVMAASLYFLLVSYLALFPALFSVGIFIVFHRFGLIGLLCAPALWVTTELGRLHLFTGFPWELLGYSQTSVLPVAQLASLFGVLGLSALVVLVNSAIAFSMMSSGNRRLGSLVGIVFVLALVISFGTWRLKSNDLFARGTPLRVAVVQGNISQHDKWDPEFRDKIFEIYLDLTNNAVAEGAELIVWPEAATPFVFERDSVRSESIRRIASQNKVHLLIGTTQIIQGTQTRYYNAAIMIGDTGEITSVYRKHHLVPFGEYVPLRKALFFVSPLVETIEDFSAGPGAETLTIGRSLVSAAICYEVIYPGLVQGFVKKGSRLLTTITNDAWYGLTSAPYQHFQQATMRAIEQGRFLVRAANTGISGVVDPFGRVIASTSLFERHMTISDVWLLDGRTFYSRTGDAFSYMCIALTLVAISSWPFRRYRLHQ